jgi:hypothetical protein
MRQPRAAVSRPADNLANLFAPVTDDAIKQFSRR